MFLFPFPIHAQQLENIPPLSFTMSAGAAGPLPQVLAVASTGTNFDFGVTTSTTSGGNWLSFSAGPNCCSTPWAVTVNVSNVNKLAAGTYNGEVDFNQFPSGKLLMAVPVTLFIEPTTTAFIDALPGALSFSMVTSGNVPPAQTFQIRNGGSGTLPWTLTASTADGGDWLQPSISSGTAPSTITVGFDPSHLPGGGTSAGTFAGQLLFQSGADSVTVPVSATVGATVFLQSNPISFTMVAGGASPLPQVLSVASTGTNFDFGPTVSTSTGGNWLNFSAGPNCCATPWAVTLNVSNVSSLPAGTYMGQVVFNKFPYATLAIAVPVTLFIESANTPFFDALPGQLSFSMKTAGLAPPAQSIEVRNGASGKLKWKLTATTSDGAAWLNVKPISGTAPKTISVNIVPSLLPGGGTNPGNFEGQLLFQSGADSVTVPIGVTVGDSVFVQANPITFLMPAGGANPLPQVLSVASTGTTNFDFSQVAVTATGGNWLSTSVGPNCCKTPWAITLIVVNASALPVGTYTGQVMLNKSPDANIAMTVPVTLRVVDPGKDFFGNIPGQSSFSFVPGSKSINQIVPITNGGPGTLNWTATRTVSDGGKWLKLSPVKGTAPSVVTVSVNNKKLPGAGKVAGTYIGQQLFTTATGTITVPVTVSVGNSVFVPLDALTFTAKVGTNPPDQTVTVASTGTNFDFDWLASTGAGNWLSLSGGINCCRTPWVVTVSVNSSALPAGNYVGQAIFTPFPYSVTAMTLPVILTVTP